MKVISKIAIVFTVGVLVTAGLSNVHAFCAIPGSSFNSGYFVAPIGQDPSQLAGKFWGIGQYNPASPGGTDNGNAPAQGWVIASPSGFYLAGDWATDALYDGCPQDAPNPQPARMGVVLTTSDGADTYFAGACTVENANGSFDTFAELPPVNMIQVPKARVVTSSRAGTTTNLTINHEPLAGGIANNTGCTLAVTGFRVYQQTVPRNAPAPTGPASRNPSAGWTPLVAGNPIIAEGGSAAGTVTCGSDSDVYLLTTLVLDGNVEISQGSRNSTRVECGPTLATPSPEGDDFRFIRKPKSAKGR